jgi:hypothetical protein
VWGLELPRMLRTPVDQGESSMLIAVLFCVVVGENIVCGRIG